MVTGYGKQKTFHGHQRVFTYFAKRDTTRKNKNLMRFKLNLSPLLCFNHTRDLLHALG